MLLLRSVVLLFICVLLTATPTAGQVAEEVLHDQIIAAQHPGSETIHQLTRELSLARKANNVARVREIEAQLFAEMPSLPMMDAPVALPMTDQESLSKTATPPWGNDVKVFTGDMYFYGKRQIALDADTLGGIYLALNARYQDSLSRVYVYKSTNGGRNWTGVTSFYPGGGYAIQSIDMCVTDTLAGKFLLGFAVVVKVDKTSGGGGHLYWISVLNDGTNFRPTLIAGANSTIGFRNPSICTDGAYYYPTVTYHYIATEFIQPTTDARRGLFITRTTNWGKNWQAPDTTLRGFTEATPVITIDWSTSPDSLCLAFVRFDAPNRAIRVARNSLSFPAAWKITYPPSPKDEYDPSLAIDPVRGNGIITYTRATGAPTGNDAMYMRSTDLFATFARDSIATTSASEELTSVSYAPWGTGYYWRVAYRTSAGGDSIYYKAMLNSLTAFYSTAPTKVSQFRPTTSLLPVVGYDRDIGGTLYRGNVAYVGYGPQDVYFDAVELTLDVAPEEGIPAGFALEQNYPNPFNPSTTIRYALPSGSPVRLVVFNTLGQQVAELVNATQEAGHHAVQFNAAGLASGVYFYELQAGTFREARKLVLMK